MLVQFGNNWIQKIPLTAKLDSACGLVQFWLSSEFFFIQLFPNWTACSPITYTNRVWFVYSSLELGMFFFLRKLLFHHYRHRPQTKTFKNYDRAIVSATTVTYRISNFRSGYK